MADWKEVMEMIYVLLIIVSFIAIVGSYPTYGVLTSVISALVVAFLEAIFGYILFEKIFE